jgi:translation initiation factor 4G
LRIDSLRKEQEKKKREDEEEAERKRTAEEEERERIRKEEEEVAKKECLRREEEECLEAQRKEEEGNAHIICEEEEQKQKDALKAGEAQLEADEADDIVETTSPVREPQCSEDGEVLDTDGLPEPEPQLNGDSGKKAKETFRMVPFSVPSLSKLPRRRPVPLDLTSAKRDGSALPPSALLTARVIENLSEVKYPEGIQSPHVELNANSKGGRFRFVDLPL